MKSIRGCQKLVEVKLTCPSNIKQASSGVLANEQWPGSWSEYAKCAEYYVALKPESLSFGDAASLPLAAVTALQAFRKYNGSLEGKTVFIPAGRKSILPFAPGSDLVEF